MSRNATSGLMDECQRLGLIKSVPGGYEITEASLSYKAVNKQVDSPIYKAICDFCEAKGVAPPVWDKTAMSVILTRYNTIGLPADHEMNIAFQLIRRCKRLRGNITLQYFIKVLGMEEQYRTAVSRKGAKARLEFPF